MKKIQDNFKSQDKCFKGFFKNYIMFLDVVVHIFDPSTQEEEAGKSIWI